MSPAGCFCTSKFGDIRERHGVERRALLCIIVRGGHEALVRAQADRVERDAFKGQGPMVGVSKMSDRSGLRMDVVNDVAGLRAGRSARD